MRGNSSYFCHAGYDIVPRNLLLELWTRASLRRYFGDLSVAQWFNLDSLARGVENTASAPCAVVSST